MGKKDEYQFDYLDDDRRFADQINGALFNGRQIVKPEELEPEDSQAVILGKGDGNVKTIVDQVRIWKGNKLHILVVENQNYTDYRMVLRNMLSESIGYRKQWRHVTNYRINLYDCHEHDTFDEYKTGLRQVFETVRYAKDKVKLREVIEGNREAYSRIDSDTRNMLEVVANIKIPENCKVLEEGKERFNMCKAFEDMRQEGFDEGIEKGIEKGIRALIQTCMELGISDDVIIEKCAEKYEMTKEAVVRYMKGCCA